MEIAVLVIGGFFVLTGVCFGALMSLAGHIRRVDEASRPVPPSRGQLRT